MSREHRADPHTRLEPKQSETKGRASPRVPAITVGTLIPPSSHIQMCTRLKECVFFNCLYMKLNVNNNNNCLFSHRCQALPIVLWDESALISVTETFYHDSACTCASMGPSCVQLCVDVVSSTWPLAVAPLNISLLSNIIGITRSYLETLRCTHDIDKNAEATGGGRICTHTHTQSWLHM